MTERNQRSPHPIDTHVGGRMRMRRIQMGLSQGMLAGQLGVSFQAVQKYESGGTRISASRLYAVSSALQVPPGFFFEGCSDEGEARQPEGLDQREVASLLRGYYGIRDPRLQADVRRLITTLGSGTAG
jgi:transcriptional regulator with XRE-family HTH domain